MTFRSPGPHDHRCRPRRLRRSHRRLLGAAHERRLREEQPVRTPGRARHAGARVRARTHVGAHRRVARDGDRVPRHQRLEVRRADLRRRHDLRELRDRELRDSKSKPTQAIAMFDVSVVDQDERVVQRGRKALLAVQGAARGGGGVEAPRAPREERGDAADDRHAIRRPRSPGVPIAIRQGVEDLRRRRRQAVSRPEGDRHGHRCRRVRLRRRSVRLRQEHADAHGGGAAQPQRRRDPRRRQAGHQAHHRRRHRVPGSSAARVPHGDRQRHAAGRHPALPKKAIEAQGEGALRAASR